MSSYLRSLRTTKGSTLLEVAQAVGKSKAYICDLELNRRKGSLETLQDLANFYDCDFEELCNHQSKRKETAWAIN